MYAKIYVKSAAGQTAFHSLRTDGHLKSWEGCDQGDGSWIGVVYPSSSFARAELAKIDGLTVFPPHTDPTAVMDQQCLAALPKATAAAMAQKTSPRDMALCLAECLNHPALHPDT